MGHKPSTQPAVVIDALEDGQVQADDMQIDDDQLQVTEVGEKQIEIDIQMRMEDREFQLQMMSMLTHNTHGMSPPGAPSYPMHSTYGYGNYVSIVAIY